VNVGLHGERLATNCLKHGTALDLSDKHMLLQLVTDIIYFILTVVLLSEAGNSVGMTD
jgi:hypothetical protein